MSFYLLKSKSIVRDPGEIIFDTNKIIKCGTQKKEIDGKVAYAIRFCLPDDNDAIALYDDILDLKKTVAEVFKDKISKEHLDDFIEILKNEEIAKNSSEKKLKDVLKTILNS